MPNNSISWAIDLLPNADLTYNLGKVDNSNSDNNRRWNIFGNITGNLTGNADTASKLTTSNLGNTTKPIYLLAGVATECNTYAGGTAVTLNGTSYAAASVTLYAPISAGTSGYILTSAGSGAPNWTQTLPVANGGTGVNSFTEDSLIMSGSSSTAALTTRAITNNLNNTDITTGTNIPTMNTIYYGLVAVNGASQSRATTIYAPTSAGTSGYILKSAGSGAPEWLQTLPITNGGTGTNTAPNQWGIIYASTTSTYSSTAAGAEGQVLIGHGTGNNKAPTWYEGLLLTASTSGSNTTFDATFSNTVHINGAATLSSTLGVTGDTTISGATTINNTLEVNGNTTIGNSNTVRIFKVYGTIETTGNVGIGTNADNTFKLYVNGASKFNGNIVPQANQTYSLGSGDTTTPLRWSEVYVGSANSYGDAYTPIYWNNGIPAAVQSIQQANFTITNSGTSAGTATISTNTSANSMVVEIVVKEDENSHISNLQSPITWEVSNETIILSATVGGRIDGYILYTK